MSNQYQEYQDKMQKTVDVLKNEFTTIRTANLLPALAVPVAWQLLRSCAGLIVI